MTPAVMRCILRACSLAQPCCISVLMQASGADRKVELVYPRDADISAGRVSILTPVGAGVIGLRTGQSILWPDRDGRERKLTIVKVLQNRKSPQPDSAA